MKLEFIFHLIFATMTVCLSSIIVHPDSTTWPTQIENYAQSCFANFELETSLTCDLYVFSLTPANVISFDHPNVILSKSYRRVRLKSHCNIINIFTPATEMEVEVYIGTVKKFIYKNFAIIQLIVIFLQQHQRGSDFRSLAKQIRKNVILVEYGGKNSTTYNHDHHFCGGDPKCILRRRIVKVGYNDIKPYFQTVGWKKGFPEQMPVLNVTPENVDTVGTRFSGVEADMMKFIATNYKVTFTLIPLEYGRELPNGTWTGKLGLLSERKLNIIIGCLPGNYRRGRIGKHSAQIYTIHFTLTSLKPEQLSSYQALLRPFPAAAWLILLASIAVVGPVTWWVTTRHGLLTGSSLKGELNITIWKTCGNAALTLLVEPWKNPPRGPATFILSGWFLSSLALQCLYSSNLIASLSIPDLEEPINTFKDSKERGKTVLIKSGSTPSLLLKKHGHLANFRVVETIEEYGATVLENKTNVAAYDINIFRFRILSSGKKLKSFYMSPKPFLIIFAGWLYSPEFKIVEAFDIAILRASDAGLTVKWFQDQFLNGSGRNRIIQNAREERAEIALELREKPLSMFQLKILFSFWIVGISASLVSFAVEILLGKIRNATERAKAPKQEYPWIYLE